ncbi:MAG: MerR family transcriptional regulator [Planctomycetes bacterium]|nr:MerR family transcriptional regulator [Planctomycetota bacterium]
MSTLQSEALTKIGDLAQTVGVTPRTVRFYEALGLVEPASRSAGGFRLYGPEQAERLRAVLSLKEMGFSLEEIRESRLLAREGRVAAEVTSGLRARASASAERLRGHISRLEGILGDVERTEQILSGCEGCDGKRFDQKCRDHWLERAGGSVPRFLKVVM